MARADLPSGQGPVASMCVVDFGHDGEEDQAAVPDELVLSVDEGLAIGVGSLEHLRLQAIVWLRRMRGRSAATPGVTAADAVPEVFGDVFKGRGTRSTY